MGEGLIWTYRRGAQSPSGKGLKGGGIHPIPPLFRGVERGDGKAHDPEYKRWDRSRLTLSAVGLCSKMADSLPVAPFGLPVFPDIPVPDDDGVPDDLPVLPDDVLLMIAKM